MFRVPAVPYRIPDRGEEEREDSRLSVTYLIAPSSCGALAAERHQHERTRSADLEPHVQVEEVAREEGAADAHQHHVVQRVVPVRSRASSMWRASRR
jgi:hypothetical protein